MLLFADANVVLEKANKRERSWTKLTLFSVGPANHPPSNSRYPIRGEWVVLRQILTRQCRLVHQVYLAWDWLQIVVNQVLVWSLGSLLPFFGFIVIFGGLHRGCFCPCLALHQDILWVRLRFNNFIVIYLCRLSTLDLKIEPYLIVLVWPNLGIFCPF